MSKPLLRESEESELDDEAESDPTEDDLTTGLIGSTTPGRTQRTSAHTEDEDEPEEVVEEEELVETRPRAGVIHRKKMKKGQAAMSAQTPKKEKQPTLTEIPRERILELPTRGYPLIRVDINRRLPSGAWVAVRGGIVLPPELLFDLEIPLRQFAGGGTFIFTVCDPNTREQLMPRWQETYDGRPVESPKDMTLTYDEGTMKIKLVPLEAGMGVYERNLSAAFNPTPLSMSMPSGGMGAPGGGMPPNQNALLAAALTAGPVPQYVNGRLLPPPAETGLPDWLRTYPVEAQWQHVLDERIRRLEQQPAAGGGGAMAQQWIHHEIRSQGDLKAEVARLQSHLSVIEQRTQERLELVTREARMEIEAAREKAVKAEKELERVRAESQYGELRAELSALRAGAGKPAFDLTAIAGLATAVMPFFTSRVSAESDERKSERDMQTKLLMTTLAKKDDNGGMLKDMAPLLVPLALKWLETNGPQAKAEVYSIEHEQRMMQLKMFADMIQAMAPEPEPAWKPVLDGIVKMIGGTAMAAQLAPPRPPARIGSGASQQAPGQPVQEPVPTSSPFDALILKMSERDPEAAMLTKAVFNHIPIEYGFHTHEWVTIIFNLHAKLEVDELSEIVVGHLINCTRFETLPLPLAQVMEHPRESLDSVFKPLPIFQQDPEYVQALTDTIVEMIEGLEEDSEEGDEEDYVESDGEPSQQVATQAVG